MDASKRTKKISMTFIGFIYALSNHKSCLTKRVEGNDENRKPQLMLGTFFWCCDEIAPDNPAGTRCLRDTVPNMANFCGELCLLDYFQWCIVFNSFSFHSNCTLDHKNQNNNGYLFQRE